MKDQVIYVRADTQDLKNLDRLCRETCRKRSDMVRWLIAQEILRRNLLPETQVMDTSRQ